MNMFSVISSRGTRQLALFLNLWLVFRYVTAGDIHRRFRHHATLERYASPIESYSDVSLAECVVGCLNVQQCQCVSYQRTTRQCEINNVHPGQTDIPGVAGPGWRVYYTPEDELMVGAEAWQSSLYCNDRTGICGYAANAVDGNTDGTLRSGSCSHTQHQLTAFWVVKLSYPVVIHMVSIYYRMAECCFRRMQNITVNVATSNVTIATGGAECGMYPGPPTLSQRLFNITCITPVYGQYVKISSRDNYLELCEVVLHQN